MASNESSEQQYKTLTHKPNAKLAVKWVKGATDQILIVFLNGLMTTLPTWTKVIDEYLAGNPRNVSLLSFDRYGQGLSDRDPADEGAKDPMHGHDVLESVKDLNALITQVQSGPSPKIIFVANSIGCAIARLYAQTYSGSVAGLLLLDSIITNQNLITAFPDPDSPSFSLSDQPEGVTEADLRKIRMITLRVFDPSVGNKEGLSRKNLKDLLPLSDGPKLHGWPGKTNDKGPYVTIVGHGFEAFAEEGSKMSGVGPACHKAYMNPFWWRYNEELCKISDEDRVKGPIEAVGAGHFIQQGRPDLVVDELREMVGKVEGLTG